MDYYSAQPQQMNGGPMAPHSQMLQSKQQQQQAMMGSGGGLNLPDATGSTDKMSMWSQQSQYMTESGYSTQAPSISSIDAFLNNEQQPQPMNGEPPQQASQMAPPAALPPQQYQQPQTEPSSAEWNAQQHAPVSAPAPATEKPQETTAAPAPQPTAAASEEDADNAVANWMNYQENSEMALKAIPELLKLLLDEDLVVVQQAAILFNQMSRNEGPRMAIIQTNDAVQCLVNCLNTTADFETARSIVGTLYNVSTHKPHGVQSIINSNALDPLVKMLTSEMETIVSYAITTLHNVLLDCGDNVKNQLRKMRTIQYMVPLLQSTPNVKFLSIVVDCLQLLAFCHPESKQILLQMGGTQLLIAILEKCQYHKLLLNTTRLLKVLSVCSHNKSALISMNAMQILTLHLTSSSNDILQNCLITLRNLSDAATRLNGLDQLVQSTLNFLSTSTAEVSISTLAAGILSNLTCNNEYNKKAALQSNAIQILLNAIQLNMLQHPKLVEPCVCALRHITNRHQEMLLAQEQVRTVNGLAVITQLMCVQPRNWSVIKASLGLVRNFCSNQLNAAQLRSNCIIEKLMQVLYDSYTEIQMRGPVKMDDVNLLDIVDASSSALLILAKDQQNQIIMKDLECIGFFVQMFYATLPNIQKAAASLLSELSASSECSLVIEQQPGLFQFVQANFYNQYGKLKTIAELSGSGTGTNNATASVILQHVTTLMQRLNDHKQQRQFMMAPQQHQQQQQQFQYQNDFAAPPPQQQQQPGQQHQQQANQMYYQQQTPQQQQPQQQQFGNQMMPQQQQQPANHFY